jgi:hypothetical protein
MAHPLPISKIYVAGYRWDVDFTRYCIASIREWNPDIPIILIKDRIRGDYYTGDIERSWNVSLFDTHGCCYGWGFSKLEPLFEPCRERFLMLDSDILVLGNIIQLLQNHHQDFIVSGHESYGNFQNTQYFDPELLKSLDRDYVHNGIGFNTGQWVGTSGIFRRDDFEAFVEFTNPPRLRHPNIFQLGEQGLLNYFLLKHKCQGKITVASFPFMDIGTSTIADQLVVYKNHISFEKPILIHWCGCRENTPESSPNGRLFKFFANRFYSRVPLGRFRKLTRDIRATCLKFIRLNIGHLEKYDQPLR